MHRATLAIDIDEIKFPLMASFSDWHNRKYGTAWNPQELKTYNVWESWDVTREEAIAKMSEFYKTPEFERQKPIEGSVRGVNLLSKGFNLLNITSRPQAIKDKTITFIARYFEQIQPEDVHFASDFYKERSGDGTKSAICKRIGAHAIIEDSLEYALDCADNGILVFMPDKPWNKKEVLPENIIRVSTWKEMPEIIYHHFAFKRN